MYTHLPIGVCVYMYIHMKILYHILRATASTASTAKQEIIHTKIIIFSWLGGRDGHPDFSKSLIYKTVCKRSPPIFWNSSIYKIVCKWSAFLKLFQSIKLSKTPRGPKSPNSFANPRP